MACSALASVGHLCWWVIIRYGIIFVWVMAICHVSEDVVQPRRSQGPETGHARGDGAIQHCKHEICENAGVPFISNGGMRDSPFRTIRQSSRRSVVSD